MNVDLRINPQYGEEEEEYDETVNFELSRKNKSNLFHEILSFLRSLKRKKNRKLFNKRNSAYSSRNGQVNETATTNNNNNNNNNSNNNGNENSSRRTNSIFRLTFSKPNYVPPPMPYVGQIANVKQLIERNQRARKIMQETMISIHNDINNSITNAQNIPVAPAGNRVIVTTNIYDRIGAARTKREILRNYRSNMNEIESALLYRQRILELMNNNCDDVLVASIVPVDINNARSVIVTK